MSSSGEKYQEMRDVEDYGRNRRLVDYINQIEAGDHISFRRRFYKHHAIVKCKTGANRFRIIHLSGNSTDSMSSGCSSNAKATLAEMVIDLNIEGKEGKIYLYYDHKKQRDDDKSPEEVAEIIMNKGLPISYNFINFNCESFAVYCKTGTVYSKQSRQANEEAKKALDALLETEDDDNGNQSMTQSGNQSNSKSSCILL